MHIQDLFSLKENIAVVTGGAGHLGSAISEAVLEAGAELYITSRNTHEAEKAVANLKRDYGSKVKFVNMDIGSSQSVAKAAELILKSAGRIDILVNNASFGKLGNMKSLTESDWNLGINGTINGTFRVIKSVLPSMQKAGYGSIINIASMYATVSPDPSLYENNDYTIPPNYAAGKAAIVQLTRYVAVNMAENGIRANSISPGPFPKQIYQNNKKFLSKLQRKVPMGRVGVPYEMKGVIVFLASRASSFVTGANIPVDGGWTAW